MQRILILGASGMLGHRLYSDLKQNFDTFGTVRNSKEVVETFLGEEDENLIPQLDVTDFQAVENAIEMTQPNVVINCVGLIKQHSQKLATESIQLNALLPWQLAEYLSPKGVRFITISTDCVFAGTKGGYSEEDLPDAKDIYGRAKALGEVWDSPNTLVLRTSIIGRELQGRRSLFEWFLSHPEGAAIEGYENAIYSGFPTRTMAQIIGNIISTQKDLRGVFNLSSSPISKFQLLERWNKDLKRKLTIRPNPEPRIDRSLDSRRLREAVEFSIPSEWDELTKDLYIDFEKYEELKERRGSYVS